MTMLNVLLPYNLPVYVSIDPAYIATSALLVQSALCIVDHQDMMPKR